MAGKIKTVYICSQCGYESSKWNGRCPSCGEWNTLEEQEIFVGGQLKLQVARRDERSEVYEL